MNKKYSRFSTQEIARTIFVFLFVIVSMQSHSQDWSWVATAGGDQSDKSLDIDIDKYGNQYICGYYNSGTSTSDPSFGIIMPPKDFGKEAYVAKIDSMGNWQWVRSAMGGWDERALGLCVDKENDYVYVTGTCWNYTDFGSCVGATFPGSGDNIFEWNMSMADWCRRKL